MTRPTCGAELEQGRTCRAFALDSGRCWNHDPARAQERQAAQSKGGKLRALQGRRKRLDSAAAVVAFVSNLVHDVAEQRVEPEVAKVLTYALSVQIKAIELAEASEGRKLLHQVEQLTRQARQAR